MRIAAIFFAEMIRVKNYLRHLHIPFWWMMGVIGVIVACCASCRTTRYVTVPEYHSEVVHDTDSVVRRDVVRDTSWMTIREVDSAELARLGVQIKGLRNALVIERNRNVEKISDNSNAKIRYIQKTDSVLVPYRVEVEKIPFVQNYLLNKKNYE